MQLANTPPLQSTTPGLHPVSIHQTAPPVRESKHLITAYYLIYRPRKNERLSWPSWLTCSGRFTHISGHPPATGRAQDRESWPAKDRRSTTVSRDRHRTPEKKMTGQAFPLMKHRRHLTRMNMKEYNSVQHAADLCCGLLFTPHTAHRDVARSVICVSVFLYV